MPRLFAPPLEPFLLSDHGPARYRLARQLRLAIHAQLAACAMLALTVTPAGAEAQQAVTMRHHAAPEWHQNRLTYRCGKYEGEVTVRQTPQAVSTFEAARRKGRAVSRADLDAASAALGGTHFWRIVAECDEETDLLMLSGGASAFRTVQALIRWSDTEFKVVQVDYPK